MSTAYKSWVRSPSLVIRSGLTILLLLASTSNAQLTCDAPPETFATGIPPGWTVIDTTGGGLIWGDLAACGEDGNFTGGADGVARASSDLFGAGAFATELRSASLDLSGATTLVLH